MNVRLFVMAAGTLLCIVLIVLSRNALSQVPTLLDADSASLSAVVGGAYAFATLLVPLVCVVSIWRGWVAWARGLHEEAPRRLVIWPLVSVAAALALFAIGRAIG